MFPYKECLYYHYKETFLLQEHSEIIDQTGLMSNEIYEIIVLKQFFRKVQQLVSLFLVLMEVSFRVFCLR